MSMMNFSFFDFLQLEPVMRGLKVLLAIMLGYLLGKFAGRGIERALSTRLAAHQVMVFKRFAFYSILKITLVYSQISNITSQNLKSNKRSFDMSLKLWVHSNQFRVS